MPRFVAGRSVALRGQAFTSPGDDIGRALAMVRALLRDDVDTDPKAYGRKLAKAMTDQHRSKIRPGEVMSREEAMDFGGEELGPVVYRLANSEGAAKPRGAWKKRR